jgi:hypothetical protein
MGTVRVDGNGNFALASIDCEQDLVRRVGVYNINPPPKNGRCECCGRHISELRPFGKVRHPIFGDLEGALLVKQWRKLPPYDARPQSIHGEMIVKGPTGTLLENGKKYLIERSGDGMAEEIRLYHFSGENKVGSSWECRDCIDLDEEEFLERLRQRRKREVEESSRN